MQDKTKDDLRAIIKNRQILVSFIVFVVVCICVLSYLAIAISPSERQVVIHYTNFGATHFYKDKWYYLLNMIAFIVVLAIVHTLLMFKIFREKGVPLAVAFVWLSICIVIIVTILFYHVIGVASIL